MYPTREDAIKILEEGAACNPGPWEAHSRAVARCAEEIARRAGMNADKAYACGLLHDIGRKFGRKHFGHIFYGYRYMLSLGYDEVARVCLSHSFNTHAFEDLIGDLDLPDDELNEVREALAAMEFDDYDRLAQLCDALAGDRVVDIEKRMGDVKNRYGYYPQNKWNQNIALKAYFEDKVGGNLYVFLTDDQSLWGR